MAGLQQQKAAVAGAEVSLHLGAAQRNSPAYLDRSESGIVYSLYCIVSFNN